MRGRKEGSQKFFLLNKKCFIYPYPAVGQIPLVKIGFSSKLNQGMGGRGGGGGPKFVYSEMAEKIGGRYMYIKVGKLLFMALSRRWG